MQFFFSLDRPQSCVLAACNTSKDVSKLRLRGSRHLTGGWPQLFSYDAEARTNAEVHLKQLLGTVVPVDGDNDLCVVAACKGVAVVNRRTGQPVEFLGPNPEANSFSLRWNDGKCDPQGRLWVGSMDMQFGEPWLTTPEGNPIPQGGLYCWEGSGESLKITKKLGDISISNGLVWDRAGTTFYYIDTPTMQVDAFDFDGKTGEISNRRCAIKCPDAASPDFHGYPDGCTIASDDTIFIACWSGSCVVRYEPRSGKLLAKYEVPFASQVTSCAFGGPDLTQLFVTTAAAGIAEEKLNDEERNAGHLFVIDLSKEGITGVPAFGYKLHPST
eukprot:m.57477 g.57477  ORF g.57477 m.57477 type:complete len:329 (+) comp9356_c1_seq2:162-1148(+)